jgi:hypothetical protein
MNNSSDRQKNNFNKLLITFRRGVEADYRDSSRDSGPGEASLARKLVIDFFQKSDPISDLQFLYMALGIMSHPVNDEVRLNALLCKSGFELDYELRKISESKKMPEEQKLFGVCFQNHEGKIQHAVFDEAGLRWWLIEREAEIDEQYFVDTKIGETYSFISKFNFILWRMIPDRKE